MKEEFSEHSLLRAGLRRDEQLISSVIGSTERKIRAMCRAMQVYEMNACDRIDNIEPDYRDLTEVFSAFYEYVDMKMDVLSELSEELEEGLSWVSVKKLRESPDFRSKPLSPDVFVSREAYENHCRRQGFEPEPQSRRQKAGG